MSDRDDEIRRLAEEVAAEMTPEQQEAYIKRIDDAARLIVATVDQIFPDNIGEGATAIQSALAFMLTHIPEEELPFFVESLLSMRERWLRRLQNNEDLTVSVAVAPVKATGEN